MYRRSDAIKSIKVCDYSRSMSLHAEVMFRCQDSGELSQDQWSSVFLFIFGSHLACHLLYSSLAMMSIQSRYMYESLLIIIIFKSA